ncbi:MetS family NSS transporter small subunit [Clostridium sp. D2Q-14]|nr:MetS family NSS transporter small subunit [Anaeromonas gelatinilytica]MBS4534073.1 MetS family NSS transporter small subunit [Anaeromonas gelatinilytica]
MTGVSIAFFLFGAVVLWGGLAVTLTIALRDGKNN